LRHGEPQLDRRRVTMNAVFHIAVPHSGSHIAAATLQGWIGSAARRIKNWMEAYASAADQAALYQQLYGLSDAELERRGIPRGELHRLVFE
jgi:hypothetical protein